MSSLRARRAPTTTKNATPNIHNYTLHVYKQGLQLPTMDIQCMMLLSYIHLLPNQYQQFINIKFENTYMNIVLHDQDLNKYYYGMENILKVIKSEIYNLPEEGENIHSEFLNSIINNQLLPCLYHYWYGYDDNYTIVYDTYVGKLSVIDGIRLYFVKKAYLKERNSKLSHKTDEQIYELVQYSLQLISNLLNTNEFILGGTSPTVWDAYLHAILSCLYYPDLVSKHYRDLFRHYPNLITYTNHITNKYFTIYVNEEIFKEPSMLGTQSPQVICELLRRLRVKKEKQFYHTWFFLGASVSILSTYFYVTKRIAVVKKGGE